MSDGAASSGTFRLEVDLGSVSGDPAEELGRVLRYWAGNLRHYSLDRPQHETVMDSEYREIGHWSLS